MVLRAVVAAVCLRGSLETALEAKVKTDLVECYYQMRIDGNL